MSKQIYLCLFTLTLLSSIFPTIIHAVAPQGQLNQNSNNDFSGWAKDADTTTPLQIHVYVDNIYNDTIYTSADNSFHWQSASFGSGNHYVEMYVLGENSSGVLDGQNTPLTGNGKWISSNCSDLLNHGTQTNDNFWCTLNPTYWANRQKDTLILANQYVKIGANQQYGGMISQLYGLDRSYNLIEEHGGSAVQLSLQMWDRTKGTTGFWFANSPSYDSCNPTKYDTEASCKNQNSSCTQFPYALGAHVSDCVTSKPCSGDSVGNGWNPIQGMSPNCQMFGAGQKVDSLKNTGSKISTTLTNPPDFHKSSPVRDTQFSQEISLHDTFAQVDYTLKYTGSLKHARAGNELPAFFTNSNISSKYYYYSGPNPFSDKNSPVTTSTTFNKILKFPQATHADPAWSAAGSIWTIDTNTEYWWSICDQSETQCVTLAAFSPILNNVQITRGDGKPFTYGYITPIGYFLIEPNMEKNWTLYMFPYKYDKVIEGKSVRERIFELATKHGYSSTNIPGDLTGDGHVNLYDYNQLVAGFGTTYSIFDYNNLVANYGK